MQNILPHGSIKSKNKGLKANLTFTYELRSKAMATIERIPDLFASIYEKATRMVMETYYDPVAEEVVSFLREGTILDLGTGPGYLPIQIAKKSQLIRIDGIDLGRKLISMARANAIRAGVSDRVKFEIGNAGRLRFEDESYDMVLSTGMFHALNDPVGVLRECYRVLNPGGEAWIYDPARVSSDIDKKKYSASLNLREKMISLLFMLYTKFNPPHSYNKEQISKMIGQTDFKEYWIEERGKEIRMKLKKRNDTRLTKKLGGQALNHLQQPIFDF